MMTEINLTNPIDAVILGSIILLLIIAIALFD